jgi:hypothetical protein
MAITLGSPDPEEYHYRVLPDAAIFLDGKAARADDMLGADCVVHTTDLTLFGHVLLRGPIDRMIGTSKSHK